MLNAYLKDHLEKPAIRELEQFLDAPAEDDAGYTFRSIGYLRELARIRQLISCMTLLFQDNVLE